jgi:hypothetical protein
LYLPVAKVPFDIRPGDVVRLARQTHNTAQLVECDLRLWAEGRQRVAEIDCVLGVSVEVGPHRQTGRGDPVDHCSIAQDRQIEAVAIEGDKLGGQLSNLVDESRDELLLCPLADMGRSKRVDNPLSWQSVCNQGADATDRMVNMFLDLGFE